MLRPAIFLDRDGTINVEKHYLHKAADWEFTPGAPAAIRALNQAGYLVLVVSNQAGIARGFYGAREVDTLHAHVDGLLAAEGARIDGYYCCPHHPDFGAVRDCDCRKPKPGMLLRAAQEHGVELRRSWMVGDKRIDVEAGRAAGARPLLVATGYGAKERASVGDDVPYAADLLAASRMILALS